MKKALTLILGSFFLIFTSCVSNEEKKKVATQEFQIGMSRSEALEVSHGATSTLWTSYHHITSDSIPREYWTSGGDHPVYQLVIVNDTLVKIIWQETLRK